MTYIPPQAFQNPKRNLNVSKHSVVSFTTTLSVSSVNIQIPRNRFSCNPNIKRLKNKKIYLKDYLSK